MFSNMKLILFNRLALHSVGFCFGDFDECNIMSAWGYVTPTVTQSFEHRTDRYCRTVRELVEVGQIDPLALSIFGGTSLHTFLGPTDAFQFLVHQQQVFEVDLESTQLGLEIAQSLSVFLSPSIAENIRLLFKDGALPVSAKFAALKNIQHTFLTLSARRLTSGYQLFFNTAKDVEFISDLIRGGGDVHKPQEPFATCLDFIFMTWPWGAERNRERLILEWLKSLHLLDIDL